MAPHFHAEGGEVHSHAETGETHSHEHAHSH